MSLLAASRPELVSEGEWAALVACSVRHSGIFKRTRIGVVNRSADGNNLIIAVNSDTIARVTPEEKKGGNANCVLLSAAFGSDSNSGVLAPRFRHIGQPFAHASHVLSFYQLLPREPTPETLTDIQELSGRLGTLNAKINKLNGHLVKLGNWDPMGRIDGRLQHVKKFCSETKGIFTPQELALLERLRDRVAERIEIFMPRSGETAYVIHMDPHIDNVVGGVLLDYDSTFVGSWQAIALDVTAVAATDAFMSPLLTPAPAGGFIPPVSKQHYLDSYAGESQELLDRVLCQKDALNLAFLMRLFRLGLNQMESAVSAIEASENVKPHERELANATWSVKLGQARIRLATLHSIDAALTGGAIDLMNAAQNGLIDNASSWDNNRRQKAIIEATVSSRRHETQSVGRFTTQSVDGGAARGL